MRRSQSRRSRKRPETRASHASADRAVALDAEHVEQNGARRPFSPIGAPSTTAGGPQSGRAGLLFPQYECLRDRRLTRLRQNAARPADQQVDAKLSKKALTVPFGVTVTWNSSVTR